MSDVSYPPALPGIVQPPYVATRLYWADTFALAAGTAQAANTIRLNAVIVKRSITISDLFVRITTLSVAGNVQLALYASDAATGLPSGSALAVTGSISTTLTGLLSADITGADVALAPGLYWFATNADNSTVVLQGAGLSRDASQIGSATLADFGGTANTVFLTWTVAQAFNTWPSLTGASLTAGSGSATAFGFKVSVGG